MYKLIKPQKKHKKAFISYIEEWGMESITPVTFDLKNETYETLLDRFHQAKHDLNLPSGYIPESNYFFVDEDEKIIGCVNIRHHLDEVLYRIRGHIAYGIRPSRRGEGLASMMLEVALKKAKKLGIDRVLMVTDKNNIASAKVIQANGGILSNETYDMTDHEVIQRYWIDLN
ncbi:MAG: GNAT family N-acetyltransferase [Acholeplasmataceae bacterium]|nr:GNAT family N-acetyltransferase [Acholeplasmataceae bacterium]MDD4194030.1 GNAT family N-acetyltransferase [Acholeplasmataceae bacterium]